MRCRSRLGAEDAPPNNDPTPTAATRSALRPRQVTAFAADDRMARVHEDRDARTMKSAFEDSKPYVLTELGKRSVDYTMNEVVQRFGG